MIYFNYYDILYIVGDSMKKDGFISTAVVYSFIIVFLVVMLSLVSLYSFRSKAVTKQINEVKSELNKEYE